MISKRSFPAELFDKLDQKGYYPYQATYYSVLFEILNYTKNKYGAESIIDIGAGEGRILKVALKLGYDKVTGVEIVPQFVSIARKELLRDEYSNKVIEILCMDALNYFPDFPFDIMFLSNPFNGVNLKELFLNFESKNLLPKLIIYVHPLNDKIVEKMGYKLVKKRQTMNHIEYYLYELSSYA